MDHRSLLDPVDDVEHLSCAEAARVHVSDHLTVIATHARLISTKVTAASVLYVLSEYFDLVVS